MQSRQPISPRTIAALTILTACLPWLRGAEPLVAPVPRLSAEVSWIGNTWSGKPSWVPQDIEDLCVTPGGDLLTNVYWEENGGNVTRFGADGSWRGVAGHSHGWGLGGGEAVCANATYVFIACHVDNEGGGLSDPGTWPPKGSTWLGVSRRLLSDTSKGAPFPGGKGGKGDTLPNAFQVVAELPEHDSTEAIRGVAATATELFVALRAQGRVVVYDAESMRQVRTLALPRVERLALARDGRLWALQGPEGAGAWQIVALDPASGARSATFTCPKEWAPSSLAIGPDGRLYVADAGVDQQVQVLDGLASGKPHLAEAIGVRGGIFAGPIPGAAGPLRFNRPRGVGLDAAGDLYVACDGTTAGGGTVLESYGPTRALRWRRYGLHFVDMVDLDPRSMTVYTKEEVYALDLAKPAGEQWTYRGYTCDPRRYPDDPRAHAGHSNAWFRELGGRPFLFTTGMSAPFLAVFRFDPKTAGEVAIPCAFFSREGAKKDAWPTAAPGKGGWRWQDANGDGAMQAGEFTATDREGSGAAGMAPIVPDASGRLWWEFADEVRSYAFTGLTPAGVPQWDWAAPTVLPRPAEFDQLRRCAYDPPRDLLVLGGCKGADRNQHWKPMGPVVSAYGGALHGKPALRWTRTLPYEASAHGHESVEAMGFDLAGDYLFVPYTRGLAAEGVANAFIKVLRLADGGVVGNLVADAVTGDIGLLDLEQAAVARKLADGRYVVFLEDDAKAKTVMFIWTPEAGS